MAATQFATIPTHAELAALTRRVTFHPSTTTDPKVLTLAQIEQYNCDGYLKPLHVFTHAEAARNVAYFDALLAKVQVAGGDSYSISSAHLTYGGVWDILTHPPIVDLVCDILGPHVVGWGSHFFCKMPGDGKVVSWHQDASYWPMSDAKTVTVWLAIDDADRANGCMKFIPGSHHHGHLTYTLSETDENNVLDQSVQNVEGIGEPVYDELLAGECSLHSDLLLHGSEANSSPRRRCGLTLRYCTPDVTAHLGWHEKGVVVRGPVPAGQWANRPRPGLE